MWALINIGRGHHLRSSEHENIPLTNPPIR
jgi:hypothetical protein